MDTQDIAPPRRLNSSFDSFYYRYKMNLTSKQCDLLLVGEEKNQRDSFFHQYSKTINVLCRLYIPYMIQQISPHSYIY